jgi:hypothetical protein
MLTRTRTRHYPYPPPTGYKSTGHAGWVRVLVSWHLCARGRGGAVPGWRRGAHTREPGALNASVWGPSGGGAFVAHTLKSLPSTPPPPPLIGGRAARAVEGLDRWGNGRHGAPSGGGVFVAHMPNSLLSTPLPPPLIGGQTARVVEGSGRRGGTDGVVVLVFQGARVVEARSSPTHRSHRRRRRHRRHS